MFTTNQDGLLNNYATEPDVYYAEYPTQWQQRRYIIQGTVAAFLVTALMFTACAVG